VDTEQEDEELPIEFESHDTSVILSQSSQFVTQEAIAEWNENKKIQHYFDKDPDKGFKKYLELRPLYQKNQEKYRTLLKELITERARRAAK
jgi:hypothetical protein